MGLAIRTLARSPGFTAVAILTLALGIGANTAIFSVVQGVVLSPLPYHEPDRLVLMLLYNRALKYPTYLSYPDFLDWQRSSGSFDQIAAFKQQGFDLTSPGEAEHVNGEEVSANFFRTLGVKLALGRDLVPEEDRTAGSPAVIISNRLWRDRFAGNPMALGETVILSGVSYTIAGILPPDFRFRDQQADVYTPLGRRDPLIRNDRTIHDIGSIARLKRGLSIPQAQAEMNTVQEHIDELNPSTERGQGTYIAPLKQFLVGDVGETLLLLLGAVGLVLLIACANVANLLLARSAAREHEFAIRLALGAGRAQIVGQLVTESVLLSLAGGALGLSTAKLGLNAVLKAVTSALPRIDNIGVNGSVLLFTLGVSVTVGILFGLLPAMKHSKTDLATGLKQGGRGSTGGHQRTQRLFVVVQIALALVLLAGGSLLFRTIRNLLTVNPGFDPRHVITFQVGLSPSVTNTPARIRVAYQQLTDRVRQIPGVEAAEITALLPLGRGANDGPFWIGARQPASMAEIPRATYFPIGPDYFSTMKIPLLRGRQLARADNLDSEPVVVIDSLLARTYFPGRDALGQSLTIPHWGGNKPAAARIVGVVGHVENYALDRSVGEKPQIYYCFYQLPDEWVPSFRGEVVLAVRTVLDSAAAMPAIRSAVCTAGADQPIYNVNTMQELVSGSMARQRFPMLLLMAFAGLAVALASVGIYGVISYSVTQRVREIGIRMALGAAKREILRMVIGHGIRLAVAGLAIGVLVALMLMRVLSSFSHLLYGVGTGDPLTFVVLSLLLTAITVLASYIPAWRAAKVDPVVALRNE